MLNINLLPWRPALRQKIRQQWVVLAVGSAVLALLCLLVADIFLNVRSHFIERGNLVLTQKIATLNPSTKIAKDFLRHEAVIRQTILLANQLESGRDLPIRLLKVLNTLPKTMALTQITYSNAQLSLSVVANTTDGHEMNHVVDTLQATGLFREVKISDFQPLPEAEAFSESFKITATFLIPSPQRGEGAAGG